MTDVRTLLEIYASEDPGDGDYGRMTNGTMCPDAIAALRAVLDLCDEGDNALGGGVVDVWDIRRAIYSELGGPND